jgi:acyl-CoA thioester hydrolase
VTKLYFPPEEGGSAPLRITLTPQVRFEEVDSLGIVWHGRYPGYFEDARVALCDKFGIGYMDFFRNGFSAPIRQIHVDYLRPLRFGDVFSIEGILHWTFAARINMEFILRDATQAVATTGFTVQLILDADGRLLLAPPTFHRAFLDEWRRGSLS